jgi:hypothetical protein
MELWGVCHSDEERARDRGNLCVKSSADLGWMYELFAELSSHLYINLMGFVNHVLIIRAILI